MNQPSIIIGTDEELALGYQFPYKKVCEWLTNQNEWQKYAPSPKDTPQGKTWKAVLQIIDVASRFKASISLILKKSSEVAKAFRKIYDNPNNPLTYPTLLQCDNAIVERFNKTLAEMLYKIQYAVE
ncbi:34188_t:CDS:2, partial [Racocetra persica]